MDNEYYAREVEAINKMNKKELKAEIKQLKEQMNDSYPDDDFSGDMALSNWHTIACMRLRELEEQNG